MNKPRRGRPPDGARKVPATTCEVAHKMRFATQEEARNMAIARMKRDARSETLAVYRCEHCGDWHHTSSVGRANQPVVDRREKPAYDQGKLDRALAATRDATGVALTALLEYPKGDLTALVPMLQEVERETKEQLAQLERFELDSPELRAELIAFRPKLRALELLARRKLVFTSGAGDEGAMPGKLEFTSEEPE